MTTKEIAEMIAASRFRYGNEDALQRGIAQMFENASISFEREVRLNHHDRIDFMIGRVGIEVKVDQPIAKVTRQIHRYSQCEQIDSLVLVSNRCRHAMIPELMNGKDIAYVFVGWGSLG